MTTRRRRPLRLALLRRRSHQLTYVVGTYLPRYAAHPTTQWPADGSPEREETGHGAGGAAYSSAPAGRSFRSSPDLTVAEPFSSSSQAARCIVTYQPVSSSAAPEPSPDSRPVASTVPTNQRAALLWDVRRWCLGVRKWNSATSYTPQDKSGFTCFSCFHVFVIYRRVVYGTVAARPREGAPSPIATSQEPDFGYSGYLDPSRFSAVESPNSFAFLLVCVFICPVKPRNLFS